MATIPKKKMDELAETMGLIKDSAASHRLPKTKYYEALIWRAGCPLAVELLPELIDELDTMLPANLEIMNNANIIGKIRKMMKEGWGEKEFLPCLPDVYDACMEKVEGGAEPITTEKAKAMAMKTLKSIK